MYHHKLALDVSRLHAIEAVIILARSKSMRVNVGGEVADCGFDAAVEGTAKGEMAAEAHAGSALTQCQLVLSLLKVPRCRRTVELCKWEHTLVLKTRRHTYPPITSLHRHQTVNTQRSILIIRLELLLDLPSIACVCAGTIVGKCFRASKLVVGAWGRDDVAVRGDLASEALNWSGHCVELAVRMSWMTIIQIDYGTIACMDGMQRLCLP